MRDREALNLADFAPSVAAGLLKLDGQEGKDGLALRRLRMDVRGIVFPRMKEGPVGSTAKQKRHADLAEGSTGAHHPEVPFTPGYLDGPPVSDG